MVQDGNFVSVHDKMRNPADDVALTEGDGYFVAVKEYDDHIKTAVEIRQVSGVGV